MTTQEQKQIEKFFNKPISEIDELDIPAYIRKRDKQKAEPESLEKWAELHGAYQNSEGEWII